MHRGLCVDIQTVIVLEMWNYNFYNVANKKMTRCSSKDKKNIITKRMPAVNTNESKLNIGLYTYHETNGSLTPIKIKSWYHKQPK